MNGLSRVLSRLRKRPFPSLPIVLLTLGYGLAAMVLTASVGNRLGVVAGGLGAVGGVCLFQWLVSQSFRLPVPAIIGVGALLLGFVTPAWVGRWTLLPNVVGVGITLVLVETLTLAMIALGVVLLSRAISQSTRLLSLLDVVVITAAICLRFAAHRNYNWSHPRFLADWAGIGGYELPLVFALLGLIALMTGLIAGMRPTDHRHAASSVLSILLALMILMWLGANFLRNPTTEIFSGVTGKSKAASGQNDGDEPIGGDVQDGGASGGGSGGSDAASGNGSASSQDAKGSAGGDGAQENASNAASSRDDDPLPNAASQSQSQSQSQSPPIEPLALVLLEEDYQPYEQVWYFRQTAASLYNGQRLVTSPDDDHDTDIPSDFSDEEVFIGGIPLPENMHRIVPVVVNLIAEQPRPFGLPSMISYAPRENPDPNYFRQSYHATSCVLIDETIDEDVFDLYSSLRFNQAGDAEWDDSIHRHYTQHPDDPRYLELAEQILAERLDPNASEELQDSPLLKAFAIKRWLEQNTTYSLDPKFDIPDVNPAEQFLFGERYGYCTHIAHASVYLMRALGIPSRIGVGYLVPLERSGKSSAIVIQSTDAHAWAEVYLNGAGWVVVDATPEKIDPTTQRRPEPDKALTKLLSDRARNKDDHQGQLEEKQSYSRGMSLRWSQIRWAFLALGCCLYAVKIWIFIAPRWVGERHVVRVTQRAAVLSLAESGVRRNFGETRSEFGQRIGNVFPEFATLTELHVRQVYGGDYPVHRSHCVRFLADTKTRIGSAASLLRRVIGRLDPRFWVLVR